MKNPRDCGLDRAVPGGRIRAVFAGLSLTEFWERFALAGVKSLLTILLIDHVLTPDAQVPGIAWLRGLTASMIAPGDTVGLASQIYGVANALVYLSIPLGGLIGDRLLGRRASVLVGGGGMMIGLLLMASLQGFLPGLMLFVTGAGLLKGNLSVQFGAFFREEVRRRRAYSYYLIFLNAGVICGPLAMGAMALAAGWQYAFVLAAAGIAVGLLLYLTLLGDDAGRDAPRTPDPITADAAASLSASSGAARSLATFRLTGAILAIYLCFAAYSQISNIVLVWAQQRVDLHVGGWSLPVGWILAMDGLLTILLVFASQAAFTMLRLRGIVIGPLVQIALGCLACAGGYLVLALGEAVNDGMLSLGWVLAYLALVDLAIVLVWPSGLSLATGLAPPGQAGLWVGLFYLHGFFANLWVGFAGSFFSAMGTTAFWLLHASIALAGAALIALTLLIAPRGPAPIRRSPPRHAQSPERRARSAPFR